MWHIALFLGLFAITVAYACCYGGGPERWTAAILIAGLVATAVAAIMSEGTFRNRFRDVEMAIMFVDLLMLFALLAVALIADRFWPLWMTAIHGFTIASHAAKWWAPEVVANAYNATTAFSAYPGLVILLTGTLLHQRRLKQIGADRSWVNYSKRSSQHWQVGGPTS